MDRNILFRGKRVDNGEWVYGNMISRSDGRCYISENARYANQLDWIFHEVVQYTVGQYTGLTDSNGKKIFEGDIINGINDSLTIVVTWYDIHAGFNLMGLNLKAFEIIGNIHDNPILIHATLTDDEY